MRLRALTTLCALTVALSTVGLAQKERPPEGGTPRDFRLPRRDAFALPNGMGVTLVPYGTLPKVTVTLVIRVGNLNEAADQIWLADLAGDLMKEGTTLRSAEEVARGAAAMGGELGVSVGMDQTSLSMDVLSEFGPEAVKLLADVVRNPLLPASELPRLKADQIRRVSIAKTQPQQMALERFRKVLYPDHPYGRVFPTEEMLRGYTVEHVRRFHADNYGAQRAHLYVVGRFDGASIRAAIRQGFDEWRRGTPPVINVPAPTSARRIYVVDRPGAAQSTIYLGVPVIDPSQRDYVALFVTNALLGGSFASRITSNIREDKGYTYSPFSSISTRYRDAYWLEAADVTTGVTGPALHEIFLEIDRLQSEPPSAEELKGIQNYVAGTFVLQNSSRGGIIGQLAFLNLHGLPDSYLTEFVRNVHAVTPAYVQRIAVTYLQDDQMTIVIAGDRSQITDQVAEFGQIVN